MSEQTATAAETAEARPEDDRSRRITPRSARGVRTRNALIAAAREVFERDGYIDARMSDISLAAGVAAGSFYTYFDGKEEIFSAVAELVQDEMLHPHVRERSGVADPRRLIELANREYLTSYKKNAKLMGLFEQVSQIDEDFRALRIERGNAFIVRNARMIRDLQDGGRADRSLDPSITAYALSAMVSRLAFMAFVLDAPMPFEKLVATVNQIWANALGLGPGPVGE